MIIDVIVFKHAVAIVIEVDPNLLINSEIEVIHSWHQNALEDSVSLERRYQHPIPTDSLEM